jgi:predicted alpha/beta hydrolase
MNKINITTADQHQYQLRVSRTEENNSPVAIIFPAMGVPASYYDNFAKALNTAGVHGVIHELRGCESSNKKPKSGDNFGYVDLIETDWPATIKWVAGEFPESRRLLIGNSLGGQLSALHLAAHPTAADGLALVASCSVYYRAYGKRSLSTLVATQALNLTGQLLGYAPGKQLGFAGNEAKDLVSDWAKQARTGRYEPNNAKQNYEGAMKALSKPILALPIANDSLAPESAVRHLVGKLPACQLTMETINAEQLGSSRLTHFSWGKHPGTLAKKVAAWFNATA